MIGPALLLKLASQAAHLASAKERRGFAVDEASLDLLEVFDGGFWQDLPFNTSPRNGRKVPLSVPQSPSQISRLLDG